MSDKDQLGASGSDPEIPDPEFPDRRNELAMIRTDLANERTLLSYARTALMTAGTGGTIITILEQSPSMIALGIALLAIGAVIFVVGVWRFRVRQKRLHP